MGAQGCGQGRLSCFLQLLLRGVGISIIIIFSLKASLRDNYKLICSLNTQVGDQGASGHAG